jgi:hypothetical protein
LNQKFGIIKQIRQNNDIEFQLILSKLRFGEMTDEIYDRLRLLKKNNFNGDVKPTILYSKNINIDEINLNEYNKLINEKKYKEYEFKIKFNEYDKKIYKFINNL